MNKVFLTAEWRKLAMVNYVVDRKLLETYVPAKTELDEWNGKQYVSLVAFMFLNTMVRGCRFPFHQDFEEVNLRFYVRFKEGGEWKRGVVFIREFVPLRMVTWIANTLYQERYRTIPMNHKWTINNDTAEVQYNWKRLGWHSLQVQARNEPKLIDPGSEEEYITQHFWGYSQKKEFTSEYHVQHEPWQAYPVIDYQLNMDYRQCYGEEFALLNEMKPFSVYLVEGSAVEVYKGRMF